ncbi:Lrp/AsnC family transcriptional regulator [Microbaculum marinisediminis]|uniref:Lrp/AsnC family transcriptional regulator n=1 Tax=Microbaculum marinisediminis TaxID=2931392 RepID=A0AAW5R3E6_9HYPH|nr:Lrp/AsnC family transcriptional regulator [Microbaculum sp. A6E488]MCT8973915.1 Lrp/AsnC family transcriptional regulator [Microbaculum sp. A6E488]
MKKAQRAETESRTRTSRDQAVPLDDIDQEIVRILQVDGRTNNSEIARRLGVTETTVRKRLSALISGNYIEVVAVPSPFLAGMNISAILGIKTTLHHVRKIASAVSERSEVRYCGIATGRSNLIVEAFFKDHDHLLRFVADFLGQIEGVVEVETSLILKIEKYSSDWMVEEGPQ